MNGFTYDGVHSNAYGLNVHRISLQTPEVRENEDEVPGIPGSYDFGNDVGVRSIEVEVSIVASNEADYNNKLRQVANLFHPLKTPKPLVLDRDSGKTFYAKYSGSYSIEKIGMFGKFTIPLKCVDPFAHEESQEAKTLEYDTGLDYDIGLRYPNETIYDIYLPQHRFFLANQGVVKVRPKIILTGTFTNPKITLGSAWIQYNGSLVNEELVIDLKMYTASKGGLNVLKDITGDLEAMELLEGDTYGFFDCTDGDSGTLEFDYDYLHL
jgi:predicted phage tail component-like protein